MPKKISGNYEVGYGKPPIPKQWKKGQSGNPSGKRKRAETLQTKLAKLAGEEISLTYNGTTQLMSRDLAMLHAVLQKAMKGDQASVRYVTEMIAPSETPTVAAPNLTITSEDIMVLRTQADWVEILERAEAEMKGQDQDQSEPAEHEEGDDAARF